MFGILNKSLMNFVENTSGTYEEQTRNFTLAKDCKTKEEYTAVIIEGMSTKLNIHRIKDNLGKRAVARISLNSQVEIEYDSAD